MIDRRTVLTGALAGLSVSAAATPARTETPPPRGPYKGPRIAVEEAFLIPEIAARWRDIVKIDPSLPERFLLDETARSDNPFGRALLDTGRERLRLMDAAGVSVQVLSLTSPGVQLFDANTATEMAALANDRLAECIAQYPKRYAGLASFAPQDPKGAAKEMERAVDKLKLNGFIINSHTGGEYLDQQKYWPILEAAEALKRPLYIHPRCPPGSIAGPFREHGLLSGMLGFHVEVSLHCMRLILSGTLDRFPNLQIVIGHMGETIPTLFSRADYWAQYRKDQGTAKSDRLPSEIFLSQFMITTSGFTDAALLEFCIKVLKPERIMFAADYPYQQMRPATQFMDSVAITEEQRAMIYYQNAARCFRLRA